MVFIRDGLICKVIWTLNIVHTYKHLLVLLRFCCNNSQNILSNLHHMDHSLSIYWLRDILFASIFCQLWNKAVINIWKKILVYTKISRESLWIIRSKWLQYSNLHLGRVRTNIGNHYMNNKISFPIQPFLSSCTQ